MQYNITPVARVRCNRHSPDDDHWNSFDSYIEIAEDVPEESIAGIEGYSHLEIIFLFDKATEVVWYGHPRNNTAWPLTGIFATRKKDRPNHLGLTTVELIKVEGRKLYIKNLDAIDGTPVADIKPVWKGFQPKGNIKQPGWVDELMKNYW